MAQGYFGSICIEDLFNGKIAKGSNGKSYVCLDDLTTPPFTKGKTNGKTYAGIGVYVNDEVDNYQNIAGITLQQTMEQREAKEKKQYIGNLKYAQAKGTAASPGVVTGSNPVVNTAPPDPIDDLPF